MPEHERRIQFSISTPISVINQLDDMARERRISRSALIFQAIEAYIKQEERK